jgi:hypothetical protein
METPSMETILETVAAGVMLVILVGIARAALD